MYSRVSMINLAADLALQFPQVVDRKCSRHDLAPTLDQIIQQDADGSEVAASWLHGWHEREREDGFESLDSEKRAKTSDSPSSLKLVARLMTHEREISFAASAGYTSTHTHSDRHSLRPQTQSNHTNSTTTAREVGVKGLTSTNRSSMMDPQSRRVVVISCTSGVSFSRRVSVASL